MTSRTLAHHGLTKIHLEASRKCTQCDYLTVVSGRRDTCDKLLNDYDDTCERVLTTSCVSLIDVYIASTTQTQPSTSRERGHKHDIKINMLNMIVGWTREKEARHVEETHKMNFCVCAHAFYWGEDDMKMKISPANSTKRCTLKGDIYLPYIPSRWSWIWWSFHAVLIFSITWSLGTSPQLLGSDFNMSPFPIVSYR